MENNSIALMQSASEKIRNNDVFYSYRQCSNFFYLTGHNEPDGILVLSTENLTLISSLKSLQNCKRHGQELLIVLQN